MNVSGDKFDVCIQKFVRTCVRAHNAKRSLQAQVAELMCASCTVPPAVFIGFKSE
jgi:hypothetical protein